MVLNFQAVNGLDSSAVLSFVRLKQLLQQQAIKLVLTQLNPAIRTQLKRGDCLLPDDPVCQVFPDLDRGLEWCENDLLGVIPLRRARTLPLLLQLNDLFPNRDVAAEFMDYLEAWDAEPGEYVYQHGQPADALDLIEVGEVAVYLGGQQEQTHRIQALGAGNVVGAIDFFPPCPAPNHRHCRSAQHPLSTIHRALSTTRTRTSRCGNGVSSRRNSNFGRSPHLRLQRNRRLAAIVTSIILREPLKSLDYRIYIV